MNNVVVKILFSFVFSFLITYYLVPFLCRLAVKIGAVDVPDGKIKLHKKITPHLGGVAVYGGFISAFALVCPLDDGLLFFVVGTAFLLTLGLVDDLIVLAPYQKLFGQLIATLCFLKGGFFLKNVIFDSFWSMGLSAFWILLVINAFNLVDVMDGLTSLLSIIAAATFLILACFFQQWGAALLLVSLIGSLLAFFIYNRPPAKIYLGDAGTMFIGGFFAAIPFFFSWGGQQPLGYLAPIIILSIPLLEVAGLIIIRCYKKIPFYNGSPDHFSLLLQKSGWSKQRVLLFSFAMALTSSFVAQLFVFGQLTLSFVVVVGAAYVAMWLLVLLFAQRGWLQKQTKNRQS